MNGLSYSLMTWCTSMVTPTDLDYTYRLIGCVTWMLTIFKSHSHGSDISNYDGQAANLYQTLILTMAEPLFSHHTISWHLANKQVRGLERLSMHNEGFRRTVYEYWCTYQLLAKDIKALDKHEGEYGN